MTSCTSDSKLCRICDKSFPTTTRRDRHETSHSQWFVGRFLCISCEKRLECLSKLVQHSCTSKHQTRLFSKAALEKTCRERSSFAKKPATSKALRRLQALARGEFTYLNQLDKVQTVVAASFLAPVEAPASQLLPETTNIILSLGDEFNMEGMQGPNSTHNEEDWQDPNHYTVLITSPVTPGNPEHVEDTEVSFQASDPVASPLTAAGLSAQSTYAPQILWQPPPTLVTEQSRSTGYQAPKAQSILLPAPPSAKRARPTATVTKDSGGQDELALALQTIDRRLAGIEKDMGGLKAKVVDTAEGQTIDLKRKMDEVAEIVRETADRTNQYALSLATSIQTEVTNARDHLETLHSAGGRVPYTVVQSIVKLAEDALLQYNGSGTQPNSGK